MHRIYHLDSSLVTIQDSWMVTRRERNYIPTKIVPHTSGNTSTWFMLRKKQQIWIIWVITVHLKIASDANVQRFRLFVSIPVIYDMIDFESVYAHFLRCDLFLHTSSFWEPVSKTFVKTHHTSELNLYFCLNCQY